MKKPIVIIPIGDIAGIGPEIVVKTLNHKEIYQWCKPIVVGEAGALQKALAFTHVHLKLHEIENTPQAIAQHGLIDFINLNNIDASKITFGKVQAEAGRAAYEFIEKATDLLKEGKADALATTTINKESLRAAKVPFIGHTEILGALLGVKDPMTMFQVMGLRVFFLSRHLSLKDAIAYITEEHMYTYIHRCYKGMQNLGIENPRLAIAGLNPHSGEHGLFGMEEVQEITPAIEHARADGITVEGPIGADSVFHLALKGRYDAVISLYHDQGHIATKMVDFEKTISVTIGMPYIRTSVDHGTAFDIAGQNLASEVSLYEAVRLAAEYAVTYKKEIC